MELSYWDRAAGKYSDEIVSPFSEGVKNPIYRHLEKIASKNLVVADIGTGIGAILPFLSEKFGKVLATDISMKMIHEAREKNKERKNIGFFLMDMNDMKKIHGSSDIAICANSIITPSAKELKKIFSEVFNVLKQKGIFLGIFPSMEAILYEAMLAQERYLNEGYSEDDALKLAKRHIRNFRCNFVAGTYRHDEIEQKHFYRFELNYRLKSAGFRNIKISKVSYPWSISEDSGYGNFYGKPEIWDWFVYAEK
ncbi:class I SAM-dependent methyltransferase [Candidatus Pacearchaeota archaeon]|nr:class I SAM-dependent methyltransferase [Candidatus Pacearchaeota archaeon]